ncbi:MAG: thymidine kinase [Holosporales bacterium]|jgi:thymidine kinase|nr:thymidine kinase [Holosporales bacterium]
MRISVAKLYFYYSAMNAGKTTKLLQSSFNYRERGMDTLLYTSKFDTRFGESMVTSRVGLTDKALTFDNELDVFADIMNRLTENTACVMVDEAQFLTKNQIEQLCRVVDNLNVPVLTYGLRSDFMGEPFEGSLYLLLWADELAEIKTICHCGRKATMNARFDASGNVIRSGEQVDIGGNERYVSLCRKHYISGQCKKAVA